MNVFRVRCVQIVLVASLGAPVCLAEPKESFPASEETSDENSITVRQHFRSPILTLHYSKADEISSDPFHSTSSQDPGAHFPCWNETTSSWGYCTSLEQCSSTPTPDFGLKVLLAENIFRTLAKASPSCSYVDVSSNLSKKGMCCPASSNSAEDSVEANVAVSPYRGKGQPPLINRGHLFTRDDDKPSVQKPNIWFTSGGGYVHPTHPPLPTHPPSITNKPWWAPGSVTTQRPHVTYSTWKPWTTTEDDVTTPKTTSTTPGWSSWTTKKPPSASEDSLSDYCTSSFYRGINFVNYNDERRITGGSPLTPHSFPWLAVIFLGEKHVCGGSLIDSTHVLTAAHCVAGLSSYQLNQMRVVLGMHNLRLREAGSQEFSVKRAIRHNGYDSHLLYNDIAVITLNRPVVFTKSVKPLCLYDGQDDFTDKSAIVAGWGSIFEGGSQMDTPRQVTLRVWSNNACKQTYGHAAPGGIVPAYMCAGKLGKDACSGDSGGPLVINSRGVWKQIALVSWGIGCGKAHYPGVYSRMSHYFPWIKSVISKY